MSILTQPNLITDRLLLRPFTGEDAPIVQIIVNDARIAEMTSNIPYPYPDGAALTWISSHAEAFRQGEGVSFAVTDKLSGQLFGAIGLALSGADDESKQGELGYWIGVEFWGAGIASEACQRIVRFGLEDMGLARITARRLSHNPASGRVLEKAGLRHTRTAEGHCGDTFSSLDYYELTQA